MAFEHYQKWTEGQDSFGETTQFQKESIWRPSQFQYNSLISRVRPKCQPSPLRQNKALTRKGWSLNKLDLGEAPLSKADFTWFSDSSYWNSKHGASLQYQHPLIGLNYHLCLWLLRPNKPMEACTLAKGKTADIYTDNRYAFRVAHDFGCDGNNMASLLSAEIKCKMACMFRNYWMLQFCLLLSVLLRSNGILNLTLWKLKENHLADTFARNVVFKVTNSSQTSGMAQRDISSNENLEKLAIEAQKLASKNEKQIWNSNNYWFDKNRKLWFRPNNNHQRH